MRWRRSVAAAVALILAISADGAYAQSDEDKAAARSLATQAAEAFSNGRFDEAVDLLSRAEALVHAPTHLLLMARAQARLGRLVAARESYLKILREDLPATAPAAFKRAHQEAKDELTSVEPKIASLRIVLEGAGSRKINVKLDEQPVPPALVGVHRPIDPGKHVVVAFPPGLSPVQESVTLGDGEKKEVKLVIPAEPLPSGMPGSQLDNPDAGGQGSPAVPPDAGGGGGGSTLTVLGLVGAGLGVVGVGVGITFLAIGSGTQSDADEIFASCDSGRSCTPAQISEIGSLDKTAASQQTIGTISLIAGGALLLAGVPLFILGRSQNSTPEASKAGWVAPYVAPNGLGVRGAF